MQPPDPVAWPAGAPWSPAWCVDRILAEARTRWLAGDRLYLARQHEYHLLAARDCRDCRNLSCAGCRSALQIANALEKPIAQAALDADEELAAREMSRGDWRYQSGERERIAGDIALRTQRRPHPPSGRDLAAAE